MFKKYYLGRYLGIIDIASNFKPPVPCKFGKPHGIFVAKLQEATAEQVNHIMVIQYENNGLQGETQAYQHQIRDPIESRQAPR